MQSVIPKCMVDWHTHHHGGCPAKATTPELRRFVLAQYHEAQTPAPRLVRLLRSLGGCGWKSGRWIRCGGTATAGSTDHSDSGK
jgi:hypothetical protein